MRWASVNRVGAPESASLPTTLRAFPDGLVELVADDIPDALRRSSEVCCSDAPSDKETPRGGRALGQSR